MSGRLEGRAVLVTGGSTGLGYGAAAQFAAEGATVFIASRRQEEIDTAAAQITEAIEQDGSGGAVVPVACDITVQADLDRLFAVVAERTGHLDAVLANAGTPGFQALGDYTHGELDRIFGLNLKGTVFTVQGALPLMSAGGSIVLMSSIEGERGSAGLGIYAATKAALQSFARTWANELAERRIRVNAISPGVVFTPAYALGGVSLESLDAVIPLIPAGRLGTSEDVARAIAFLASDDSAFVNGTNLVVDGGQTGVV